ncbi:hypothetical protein CDAR_611711 [Caerostris darwini]|uniref:Uncharacterized protein n=1 Tax=Caerostris darwini TaxID=1538125 RepID=A0AAV4U2X3_9ARAC|nr:hypothetical protein CDAR_611711 [Caerostris darwini]
MSSQFFSLYVNDSPLFLTVKKAPTFTNPLHPFDSLPLVLRQNEFFIALPNNRHVGRNAPRWAHSLGEGEGGKAVIPREAHAPPLTRTRVKLQCSPKSWKNAISFSDGRKKVLKSIKFRQLFKNSEQRSCYRPSRGWQTRSINSRSAVKRQLGGRAERKRRGKRTKSDLCHFKHKGFVALSNVWKVLSGPSSTWNH